MEELLDKLTDMKVLQIKEGDTLIVRISNRMNNDQIIRMTEQIKSQLKLPDSVRVLVIDNDIDMAVVRKG